MAFSLTKGVNVFMRILTKRQPFYELVSNESLSGDKSLKNIINQNNSSPIVIFYEGIRTNGLGTIKISKSLT